jgi:hypothetical protein
MTVSALAAAKNVLKSQGAAQPAQHA